jgi:hypothetical protein
MLIATAATGGNETAPKLFRARHWELPRPKMTLLGSPVSCLAFLSPIGRLALPGKGLFFCHVRVFP